MCNCKKKNCQCGCSSSSNDQSNSENKTNQEIVNLSLPGHPTIWIDEPEEIALFNFTTGKGSGIFEGWAIHDGKTHIDINTGKSITTRNVFNRVLVGCGDQYEVGDEFGTDTHTLITAEMPAHTHTVTDEGHTHTVTDEGHTHTVTDEGHTHTVTDPGHTHAVTSSLGLDKSVADASQVESSVNVASDEGGPDVPDTWNTFDVDLVGSVSINNATTGVTIAESEAGISIAESEAGISIAESEAGISIGDAGEGEPHENRQPSVAMLCIKRIYTL